MKTHILCLIALCYASNYTMDKYPSRPKQAALPKKEVDQNSVTVTETTTLLCKTVSMVQTRGEKLGVLQEKTFTLTRRTEKFRQMMEDFNKQQAKEAEIKKARQEARKKYWWGRILNCWENF